MFTQLGLKPAMGLGIVLVAFIVAALINLDVPGIYMDSTNPDYLSVFITKPAGEVPAWIYPDNILFPGYRYPVLSSLYGGATPAYLAIPYFKLFGHSIASFRVYHVAIGAVIVALNFWLLNRLLGDALVATLGTLALALDPSFLFAWRSQFYLQLFPLLTFLPALWFLARAVARSDAIGDVDRRLLAVGALLCGFSAWGYWIFALYAAALFVFIVGRCWRRPRAALTCAGIFILAFLAGYSPFLYGHLSIVSEGGLSGYLQKWTDVGNAYGVYTSGADGLVPRIRHFAEQVRQLPDGSSIASMMLGDLSTNPSTFLQEHGVKVPLRALTLNTYGRWLITFLVAGCIAAVLVILIHRRRDETGQSKTRCFSPECQIFPWLIATVGLMHLIIGMAIGRALSMQHYIMLLPLAYLGCFLGIELVCRSAPDMGLSLPEGANAIVRRWSTNMTPGWPLGRWLACAGVLFVMLAYHLPQTSAIYRILEKTGGRGYWTDAINRLADYAHELPPDAVFAFTQWGYWMGVATANGAVRPIWQSPSINLMIEQIKQRPPQGAYAIVINTDSFSPAVGQIETQTDLKLQSERAFTNRIGEPAVTVGLFRRP